MVPVLLPPYEDETLLCWQRRLASVNGFQTPRQFVKAFVLEEHPRAHGERRADALESFSKFFENLHVENTISDIFLATTCYGGLAPFLSKHQQTQYINTAFRSNTLGSSPHVLTSDKYFCPDCWGEVPFFHRSHQIPGVRMCNKHHRLLHYYDEHHQEIACTPNAPSKIMEKYSAFVASLLRIQPDADIQATKLAIVSELKSKGYHPSADAYQKLAHDMEEYSDYFAKGIAYFLSDILGGSSYIPVISTIAFLCFLFPSVEDFVSLLPSASDMSFARRLSDGHYILCSPMRYNLLELQHKVCGTHFLTTAHAFGSGWSCPVCDAHKSNTEIFSKLVDYTGNGEYKLMTPYNGMSRSVEILHLPCSTISNYIPVHFLGWRRCPTCQRLQVNSHYIKLFHLLKERFTSANVIFAEDIVLPFSDYGVKKSTLKGLLRHKILSRIAAGIYTFPGATFSIDEIIFQRYISQNGDARGFYFGRSFAYQIGLLKAPPEVVYITTNKEAQTHGRKVCFMGKAIYLRGCKTDITVENVLVLQLLSLLPNLVQYSDYEKDETYRKLAHHVLEKHINLNTCKQYYSMYPHWVPSCIAEIERIIANETAQRQG